MSTLRAPLIFTGGLTGGVANVRESLTYAEAVTGGQASVRTAFLFNAPLTGGVPSVRSSLTFLQAVIPVPDDPFMATAVFPNLPGLTWSVHKAPGFSTLTSKHSSGRQTRSALMVNPIWTFTLVYEFLSDRAAGVTQLKKLLGFFLGRQGSFDEFLYQDTSTPDFVVTGGAQAIADGVTLQWPLARVIGEFSEPVGQLDTTTLTSFDHTAVNTGTNLIAATAHGLKAGMGPIAVSSSGTLPSGLSANVTYWLAVPDANHFGFSTSLANALAGTLVPLTTQGTGTHTVKRDIAVYDNGTLLDKTAYSVLMPNQLVFVVAPTAGHAITADFQFFYVCHFTTDSQDYEEFAEKMWTLQKCEFESVIP